MRLHLPMAFVFTLALSACAPFPHTVALVPRIEGTVTASGRPVQDANLYLSKSATLPCSDESEAIQTTNSRGKFKIEPINQLRFIYAPMVAPISISTYTLCISRDHQPFTAHKGLVFPYGRNRDVLLSCDLDGPHQITLPDMVTKAVVVCEQSFSQ